MCEEIKTKVCSKCGRELPLDENYFYKNSTIKSGFVADCKECRGQKFGQRKKATGDGWRICPHCNRKLPATKKYFAGSKRRSDGLHPICKECNGQIFKEPPPKAKEGYKVCSMCGRELPATREYYYHDSSTTTGCVPRCLECMGLSFGYKKNDPCYRNEKGEKKCCRCDSWLLENEFNNRKSAPDGLTGHCKQCAKIDNDNRDKEKLRSYNHRPEVKERRKERAQRPDVKEKDKDSKRKYDKSDKGKAAIKRYRESEKGKNTKRAYREHYEQTPQYKESLKKYNQSEKGKLKARRYGQSEKGIAAFKRYRASDKFKERMKIAAHNRRAKMRELNYSLTPEQWDLCKEYFDNRCCYCGKKKKLEQDHFIALNKNGDYEKQNIVCACKSCNASKCDHDVLDWYEQQPFYSETRKRKILKYLDYVTENIQQRALF